MKIFVLDKTKLVKFNLTQKNGDTFVYSYKPVGVKKECLITFEYISICPASGVNLIALETRFVRTCSNLLESAYISTSSSDGI